MRRVLKGCARFKFTVASDCRSKSLRTGNPRLQGLVLCARQRIRRLLCCYFLTCLGKLPVIRSRTEYLANFWKDFWLFLIFLDLCCVEVARVKLLETDWGPELYFLASIFNWLRDYMHFNTGMMRWENLALCSSKCLFTWIHPDRALHVQEMFPKRTYR